MAEGPALVATTSSGQPLRVELEGRRYRVAADPVRWYERRSWWEEVARAPRGLCPHLVDREIWRVQVAPERPGGARRRRPPAEAELITMELERHRNTGAWSLLSL
ncbi:hypothetical protein NBM05_08905 [Rothia sp. AR01]|uniref:Uncharacterized protein n=1 Tax=Rothia santali TaxID=2949643 RepID=A0A9X2HD77_9MICC|nr:hypothetical protein [Rothia santali]MCP3426120.1 hypothetical protein [Rothia santali]